MLETLDNTGNATNTLETRCIFEEDIAYDMVPALHFT